MSSRRYCIPMILSLTSKRLMNQLACRFCANNEFVHVVDPLLDLRHRFNDKQQLRTMLKARRFDVNVDDVEAKYQRWWKAYECVCADQLKESRDAKLKGQLLSESEGLLSALRLPNDLAPGTPTVDSASEKSDRCVEKSPKHMEFLRKAGMIKLNESASTLHTVGLPSSLQNSIEKAILQNFMASSIMVSPPHMVRGAIIEAANLPKEIFPAFSDSTTQNASSTYLTGHGLLAFLAIFTKCHFKKSSNEWPIRVLSSGASYRNRTTTTTTSDKSLSLFTVGQRKKVAQLSICYSEEQESDEYTSRLQQTEEVLKGTLQCQLHRNLLPAHKLYNYESSATNLCNTDGIEIARISRSGVYIPTRLNIICDKDDIEDGPKTKFVRLVYVEIDITRSVGVLIEEHLMDDKPVPESIRQMI